MNPESGQVPAGFNLVGHLSGRMGLGTAARMTLDVIRGNQWPVEIVDLAAWGMSRIALGPRVPVGSVDAPTYSATVLHLNPEQMLDEVLAWRPELLDPLCSRHLSAVPYWELPRLPDYWLEYLASMDTVLAPTKYIEKTITDALAGLRYAPPVVHFEQAVAPPATVARDRQRWFGARSETFVVLSTFDLASDPARKNPDGALDTFLRAAGTRRDVTLVLKVGYGSTPGPSAQQLERLQRKAEEDGRIILVLESLSHDDMWSLLASADVYISLHRAEGLGLGMMESMALGTPVMGTGWSGNMDFMDDKNSLLVPYRLVPVTANQVPLYVNAGDTVWAEPDLDEAARLLMMLFDDAELRTRLGHRARQDSVRRWERYQRGAALAEVLSASQEKPDAFRAERHRRLRRLVLQRRRMRGHQPDEMKRKMVGVLRRLGLKPPAPPGETQPGGLMFVDPYDVAE